MKICRRRRYPRPKPPTKSERAAVWKLFDRGSEQDIATYLAAETAKIRATWDRLDELRRRGIGENGEPRVELVEIVKSVRRRNTSHAEY